MVSIIFTFLGLLLFITAFIALINPRWVKAPKASRILGFLLYFTGSIVLASIGDAFMTPEQKAKKEQDYAIYLAKKAADESEKAKAEEAKLKAYEESELKKTKDELEKTKTEAAQAKEEAEKAKEAAANAKAEAEKVKASAEQTKQQASGSISTKQTENTSKTDTNEKAPTNNVETSSTSCAKNDTQCIARGLMGEAEVYCAPEIEKLARFDMEWTDGMFELKFDGYRPSKKKGIVILGGDKLKMQNGFGAWQKVQYECDMNIETRLPVAVRVIPK